MPQVESVPASSFVRTVLGDTTVDDVGLASMHEHVLVDGRVWYTCRDEAGARFRDLPVTVERIGDVRWNGFSFLDNMVLDDTELATHELSALGTLGPATVVDMTCHGLGGRPEALPTISRNARVSIVLGCGYYVHRSHDPEICTASVATLVDRIDREVRKGVYRSGIQPGVIGEIGMSGPPEPCERRVLSAAAAVAARYGMSLHIHTDNGAEYGVEHVEDCVRAGLPPDRVVVGHMDERLDQDYHLRILDTGANLAFDTFGSELNFSGLFHHPSDRERMRSLSDLLGRGYASQIVLGQDVFVKAHLHAYGGYGYDHIPARIVPALEIEYGISREAIHQMLKENPRRLLACNGPPRRPSDQTSA
jgi:phosphotriesterase-related protein